MTEIIDKPVALVTGASSGIGQAIAQRLGEHYKLALCARRVDRLEALVNRLNLPSEDVLIQDVDLREENQILAFFHRIRQHWGGLEVLVNNAGLGHNASLLEGKTSQWKETLDVNVLALCICTREAVCDMRQRGDRGHVVHINSLSGHRVPTGSALYAASKFAVRALTEALRQELRAAQSAIKVSAISPGYVETEFATKYYQSQSKATEVYSRFPVLQPEDIAEAVWYVLSQPDRVQVHDILVRPTQQVS